MRRRLATLLYVASCAAVVALLQPSPLRALWNRRAPASEDATYDAVIIPGGGLDPLSAQPHPWVQARLRAALALDTRTRYFIVLSRGTTHRPPPRDAAAFPISEAAASARFLLDNGLSDPSRILLDTWSLDTIGNALFARTMLCHPLRLRNLCVITSTFHMPRTRAVFDWVFALDSTPASRFSIDYVETYDAGLSDAQSTARLSREMESLDTLKSVTIPTYTTLEKLGQFVFQSHAAYSALALSPYQSASPQSTASQASHQAKNNLTSTY